MKRFKLLPGYMLGLLLLLRPSDKAFGQEKKEETPKRTTTSAASFGGSGARGAGNTSEAATQNRLGNVPVNLYTGTPVINFPIYTLQEGPLSVPVSLGYTSNGLRPGETASWCGLGWTLQAGGMVTRQVRGVPDEGLPVNDDGWWKGYYDVGWDSPALDYDHEPDVFFANCNGQTVRFMLDENKVFRAIPDADIRIEAQFKNNRYQPQVRTIKGWKITFPDGTQYVFGAFGKPDYEADDFDYAIAKEIKQGLPNNDDNRSRTPSAWHLRRLESAQGQAVTFNYRKTFYAYPQLKEQEVTGIGTPSETVKVDKVYVSASVLYSIEGLNTIVYVNKEIVNYETCYDPDTGESYDCASTESPGDVLRDDLLTWHGNNRASGKILKKITVEDRHDGNRKLTYSFDYGYFTTDAQNPHNSLPLGYTGIDLGNTHYKRLRLNQFTMPDGTTCSFTYNYENYLPSCVIRSIDHWGYYNAAGGGGGNHLIGIGDCQASAGWMADRSVRNIYATYGQLNTISLSSGLETTLVYEGNQAHNYGEVGGLRIKQIVAKDLVSNYVTIKEYEYTDPANNSRQSGFLSLRPVYRFDKGTEGNPPPNAYYNSSLYQVALAKSGKPIVGYSHVKESTYAGVNLNANGFDRSYHRVGAAVSQFNQYESVWPTCEQICQEWDYDSEEPVCLSYVGHPNNFSNPWQYQVSFEVRAGSLKKQTIYNRGDQKVSEMEMIYDEAAPSGSPRFIWDKILIYNGMVGRSNGSFNFLLPKFRVTRQISRQYDQNGVNAVESTVEYTYKDQMDGTYRNTYPGKHNMVVKTTTWDSKGQATDLYNRYAADFEFSSAPYGYEARAIYDLRQKHMLAAPIEAVAYKNGKCLSASYTSYKSPTGWLDVTYTLDRFPLTDFTALTINGGYISRDSRYREHMLYLDHTQYGTPRQIRGLKGNGAITRTEYGYNDLLPLSVTADHGAGHLSMTTTYTHYPLWGVATQRLPNGTGLSYNYDDVGRLQEERNQHNQILKRIEYKRKDQ